MNKQIKAMEDLLSAIKLSDEMRSSIGNFVGCSVVIEALSDMINLHIQAVATILECEKDLVEWYLWERPSGLDGAAVQYEDREVLVKDIPSFINSLTIANDDWMPLS